ILVGMKDGAGPYSNASLVGSYSATDYIFTGPALQQPHLIADINALPMDLILNQAPPVGFRTEYLTVTFDGNGNFTLTNVKNLDGTVSSKAQTGTYSVASDGSLSIGGGVFGQVNADASGFLAYQPAGQNPEIVVGMKNSPILSQTISPPTQSV